MGKNKRPSVILITSKKPVDVLRARNVFIRCDNSSASSLFVGINEDASDKLKLAQGESISLNAESGDEYNNLNLRFDFETPGVGNKAIVIIEYIGEDVC